MALSELERSVTDAIARRGDELVALAASLVALDTTARNVGDPPRQEAELQRLLADRQADAGAEIDLFEPDRSRDGRAGRWCPTGWTSPADRS